MSDYVYVVSKLGGDLVMDVEGCKTDSGTPIIVYPKKSSGNTNQLWRKERVGDSTYYLVSKLGSSHKLSIQDGKAVISSFGQLLRDETSKNGAAFFITVQDDSKVLDVEGSGGSGARVIAYSQKPGDSNNQLWEFYPE